MAKRGLKRKFNASGKWSISEFETNLPHLTNWIKNEIKPDQLFENNTRLVIISAPVKAGKRKMVEYLSMRDLNNDNVIHIYLTALCRKDTKSQFDEMQQHNIKKTFALHNKREVQKCCEYLEDVVNDRSKILKVHLDEDDYGTDGKHLLSEIWNRYIKNNERCICFAYSASGEEIEIACEQEDEGIYRNTLTVTYDPPANYRGAKWFLDHNLVFEAEPFYVYNNQDKTITGLSPQGQHIMDRFLADYQVNPRRNIVIIRALNFDELLYEYLTVHFPNIRVVLNNSRGDFVKWDDRFTWRCDYLGMPHIFILNQIAIRSTELKCHDRIHTYHCLNDRNVCYNSAMQRDERVNHYLGRDYLVDNKIYVYSRVADWQLAAKIITRVTWAERTMAPLSSRITTKFSKTRSRPQMEQYIHYMLLDNADQWDEKYSQIKGKQIPGKQIVIGNHRNPFKDGQKSADGKWLTFQREWQVLTKEQFLTDNQSGIARADNSARSSRIYIIYDGDQLMVAFVQKNPNEPIVELSAEHNVKRESMFVN